MVDQPDSSETISVIYDGGLAAEGQLKFYEFSRASYGFARMISTIEFFRRTGKVPQRVSRKTSIDVIIRAPEKGSFPIDILIPIATELAKEAPKFAEIPVKIFLKYILDSVKGLLTPKQEKEVLELTKLYLRNEEERTKQSELETERIKAIRDMNHDSNVTAQAAIDVIRSFSAIPDTRTDAIGSNSQSRDRILKRLSERKEKEVEFAPYQRQLAQIGSQRMAKLSRKVRPQLSEVGLPLRNSAEILKFSANRKRDVFTSFDQETIADVNSRSIDEKSTIVEVVFVSYDRDLVGGKIDIPDEDIKRLSYSIPHELKFVLQKKILAAIEAGAVRARIRYFRNKDGSITSAQVEDVDIVSESDYEEDED